MHPFPHRYAAGAHARPDGDVRLTSPGVPDLATAPPEAFGGTGDRWSPETLLVGAVADCFILTFRSIAVATSLPWASLSCEAEGTLDRVERVTRFTGFTVRASLVVSPGADEDRARQALERAEHLCLVTNSLNAPVHFETGVRTAAAETA